METPATSPGERAVHTRQTCGPYDHSELMVSRAPRAAQPEEPATTTVATTVAVQAIVGSHSRHDGSAVRYRQMTRVVASQTSAGASVAGIRDHACVPVA